MFAAMKYGLSVVAKLSVKLREVEVRRQVFRIQRQCFLELLDGLQQKLLLSPGIGPLHFRPFEISLAQFVDDLVVLAEIKTALVELRIVVFQDAAEFADGLVEKSVLLVYQAVDPGNRPARGGRIEFRGALKRGDGI